MLISSVITHDTLEKVFNDCNVIMNIGTGMFSLSRVLGGGGWERVI